MHSLPSWFSDALSFAVLNGGDALLAAKSLMPVHKWAIVVPDDPRAVWHDENYGLVALDTLDEPLHLYRRRLWRDLPTPKRGHERAIPTFDGHLVAVDDRGHGLLAMRGRTVEIALSNFVEVKEPSSDGPAKPTKTKKPTQKQRLLAELMALLDNQ